jgi:hypothetical protein
VSDTPPDRTGKRESESKRARERRTERERERERTEREGTCPHTHGAKSTNTVSIHVGTPRYHSRHTVQGLGFRVHG